MSIRNLFIETLTEKEMAAKLTREGFDVHDTEGKMDRPEIIDLAGWYGYKGVIDEKTQTVTFRKWRMRKGGVI